LLPLMQKAAELAKEMRTKDVGTQAGQGFVDILRLYAKTPQAMFENLRDAPFSVKLASLTPVGMIAQMLRGMSKAGKDVVAEDFDRMMLAPDAPPGPTPEGPGHINRDKDETKKAKLPSSSSPLRPDLSDIERMGFVFGSGGAGTDHARRTADATRETAALLKQHLPRIRGPRYWETDQYDKFN
jgi:hypothetical protein